MISLIVAAAQNNAIGKDNRLLWHLPNDLKFFKNTTWGMPVIMGRKTFESVGKPLPGRFNIVVTRQPGWSAEGVWVAGSLDEAIARAESTNCLEIFVAGGGDIYRQAMERAGKIYMTRVDASPEADAYFPELHPAVWEQDTSVDFPADEKHAYRYSFQVWKRRKLS